MIVDGIRSRRQAFPPACPRGYNLRMRIRLAIAIAFAVFNIWMVIRPNDLPIEAAINIGATFGVTISLSVG